MGGRLLCRDGAGCAEERTGADAARLKAAYRFERDHWIYVHLEGSPRQIGYQHGWLLAQEIEDALAAVKLEDTTRPSAIGVLPQDRRGCSMAAHRTGISPGTARHCRGCDGAWSPSDLWDVVALNAMEDVPNYYVPWLDRQEKRADAPRLRAPGNCSAFVATGAWTKDHEPVIAHNNWTSFMVGERWRIIFDVVPSKDFIS